MSQISKQYIIYRVFGNFQTLPKEKKGTTTTNITKEEKILNCSKKDKSN